jgi:hypothetical protein
MGLINKKYYFFNIPCTEAEYKEKIIKFQTLPENEKNNLLEKHFLFFPRRYLNEFENEDFH